MERVAEARGGVDARARDCVLLAIPRDLTRVVTGVRCRLISAALAPPPPTCALQQLRQVAQCSDLLVVQGCGGLGQPVPEGVPQLGVSHLAETPTCGQRAWELGGLAGSGW
jgi:hypothetical protein